MTRYVLKVLFDRFVITGYILLFLGVAAILISVPAGALRYAWPTMDVGIANMLTIIGWVSVIFAGMFVKGVWDDAKRWRDRDELKRRRDQ